jgi:hypothetical protein
MLEFSGTFYGSLCGDLEEMFKHNVVIDSFEELEDIDDENEIIMNVNVSYATNVNEGKVLQNLENLPRFVMNPLNTHSQKLTNFLRRPKRKQKREASNLCNTYTSWLQECLGVLSK